MKNHVLALFLLLPALVPAQDYYVQPDPYNPGSYFSTRMDSFTPRSYQNEVAEAYRERQTHLRRNIQPAPQETLYYQKWNEASQVLKQLVAGSPSFEGELSILRKAYPIINSDPQLIALAQGHERLHAKMKEFNERPISVGYLVKEYRKSLSPSGEVILPRGTKLDVWSGGNGVFDVSAGSMRFQIESVYVSADPIK